MSNSPKTCIWAIFLFSFANPSMFFPHQNYTRNLESRSQSPLFDAMASHYQTEYRTMHLYRAGMVLAVMKLHMEMKVFSLATLGNHSTLTQRQGIRRTPFLTFSLPRPDSPMDLFLSPQTFGHLPVPFGRFLASDLCLKFSPQVPIVSPRRKSKRLVSYLRSGGKNERKEINGSTKRGSSVGQLGALIMCAGLGT